MREHAHTSAGVASGELAKGHLRRQAGTHVSFSSDVRPTLPVAKAGGGGVLPLAVSGHFSAHPVDTGSAQILCQLLQRRCQAFAEHSHSSLPFRSSVVREANQPRNPKHDVPNTRVSGTPDDR
jgi:hypothetical protein